MPSGVHVEYVVLFGELLSRPKLFLHPYRRLNDPLAILQLESWIVEPVATAPIPIDFLVEDAWLRCIHRTNGIAVVAALQAQNPNGFLGAVPAIVLAGCTYTHLDTDFGCCAPVIGVEDFGQTRIIQSLQ